MIWSDEQTEEFKRLADTGISYSAIAERINEKFGTSITRNACIGKANRLGMQRAENLHCGLSAAQRKERAAVRRTAYFKKRGADRKAARWAAKPWLEDRARIAEERRRERAQRSTSIRASCQSKTSPMYRNHLPRMPEMTKGELRAMLRAAVENTL